MKVHVFIDRQSKNNKIELKENLLVKDLLDKLKINPVTVIVARNNEVIPEDEKLNENDEIKILSVVSGG